MTTFLSRLPPIRARRKSVALALLLGGAVLVVGSLTAQEARKAATGTLTVEEVVTMVKSGLTDDLIIAAIKSKAKPFDLNTAEIIELKKSGVSQIVIEYLLDPSKPYAPPTQPLTAPPGGASPPPAPAVPARPLDPVAARTPPDVGLYYLTGTKDFSPLDLRPVVSTKEAGKNSKLFGLLKGHIVGSIVDAKAKRRLTAGAEAVFFLRLAEKGAIDDYALLRLEPAAGRRNLDFGTAPGKPVFPFSARASFESKQMAPGLYRLSVGVTKKGEYLFFILGSGDESKGLLGKGYDFGVD
jgi:hypothetical protein